MSWSATFFHLLNQSLTRKPAVKHEMNQSEGGMATTWASVSYALHAQHDAAPLCKQSAVEITSFGAMFGVFRKQKRSASSKQELPPPRPSSPISQHPPGAFHPHQKNHLNHGPQHQTFNPVMYVTGPGSAPQFNTHIKEVQPYQQNGQPYQHNGAIPYPPESGPIYQTNGGPPKLVNGSISLRNGGVASKNQHITKHNHINIGPPPVQNKWVDLDDPKQKVRKSRRSRGHNPAVMRSNSAGSVKSQTSSVGSCYSTKSEQFKNSVRIPDTKFSGSWTSNESVNNRSRANHSLMKERKRVREWNVDVGPRRQDAKPTVLSSQMAYTTYRAMAAGDLPLKTSTKSLKSSCGNVSSTDSCKHPYVPGYLSSGTPPPAYHSDPLSSVNSSNGYVSWLGWLFKCSLLENLIGH